MDDLMKTYRAASTPIRRQFRATALFAALVAIYAVRLYASGDESPVVTGVPVWFTRENIVMVVALVYGAGMLREQFKDVRERLSKVEGEFARNDVVDARLKPLERDYARRVGRD